MHDCIICSEARGLAVSRPRRTVLDNCTDPRPWNRRGHQKLNPGFFPSPWNFFCKKKTLGFI